MLRPRTDLPPKELALIHLGVLVVARGREAIKGRISRLSPEPRGQPAG
jgi:hypothetical protein